MKKYLAVLGALSLSVCAQANAAGDPAGGWYGFGTLGGVIGGPEYTYTGSSFNNVTQVDMSGTAFTLGAGRELRHTDNVTVAVEFDVTGGDIKSAHISGPTTPCLGGGWAGCEAKVEWLTTARVVVGAQRDKTTPYFTAGLAYGQIKGFADQGACGTSQCGFDKQALGWTAGVGLRHELTDKWGLKAEALYVDLGTPGFTTSGVTSKFNFTLVNFGATYKF